MLCPPVPCGPCGSIGGVNSVNNVVAANNAAVINNNHNPTQACSFPPLPDRNNGVPPINGLLLRAHLIFKMIYTFSTMPSFEKLYSFNY